MARSGKDAPGTLAATPVSSAAISGPKTMRYHAIDDQELASLMKFEKPFAVAFAATFIGLALGTGYQAFNALLAVLAAAAKPSMLDLAYLIGSPVALAIGATLALVAARGRSNVVTALRAISERTQVPLPRGHPAAPQAKI